MVSGTVDVTTDMQAPNGNNAIDMSGSSPGTLSQGISFGSNVYKACFLTFQLSGNPDTQGVYALRASIGDKTQDFTYVSNGNTRTNMKYVLAGFEFLPGDNSRTLTLQSLNEGSRGPMIDNVVVSRSCL